VSRVWPSVPIPSPLCRYARASLTAVLGGDDRLDVASNVEIANDFRPARRADRNQVIQNSVDRCFVEEMLVAVAVQVELERLEFNDKAMRHITYVNSGEVGIAGSWAQAGELRAAELDQVVPIWGRIR
jgi:hypothetical protein